MFILALTGTSFSWSTSVGQGWAAVEVVFALVNGLVLVSTLQRTDEKAIEVKKFLESTGNLQHSLLLGVVERVFTSAYHVGSTLLIAEHFWLVILMIPLHSVFNLVTVRLSKKSPVVAELFVGVVGSVVLLVGLLTFSQL